MKKTKLISQLRLELEKGLKDNGHTRMKKIEISCMGTEIVIRGKVESYYAKQMVLSVVKRIVGGMTIMDNVSVD